MIINPQFAARALSTFVITVTNISGSTTQVDKARLSRALPKATGVRKERTISDCRRNLGGDGIDSSFSCTVSNRWVFSVCHKVQQ